MSELVAALAAEAPRGALAPTRVALPPLADDDVEVAVDACALCHSDLHLLDGDWSSARFPLVPGHEIVGRVRRVGARVRELVPGARVGVGWQAGACFACATCDAGEPQLCARGKVRTCVGRPGGLAEVVRADRRFCFPVPDALTDEEAAPLLCAGLTVFAALERHVPRTGARVGIVGVGGLGHLAVQIARAMGAHVVAFDPDASKADEARVLGAHGFHPADPRAEAARAAGPLDLVLTTTHAALDWDGWLGLLDVGGTLCLTGVPPGRVEVDPDHLLDGQKRVTGSVVGSPRAMRALLAFAAAHGVRPRVEVWAPGDVNAAFDALRAGRARYRIAVRGPFAGLAGR